MLTSFSLFLEMAFDRVGHSTRSFDVTFMVELSDFFDGRSVCMDDTDGVRFLRRVCDNVGWLTGKRNVGSILVIVSPTLDRYLALSLVVWSEIHGCQKRPGLLLRTKVVH
jgi:hypothetical protein